MDILIDLDGTIVDPAAGIMASVEAGLAAVGIAAPARDTWQWVIGPGLRTVFPKLGVPPSAVEAAVDAYRVHYRAGAMFDVRVYPGAIDTLAALRSAGHRLFIVTAKPHVFARSIVAHVGAGDLVAAVYGPELDGTRDDKADLIAHVRECESVDPARAVMIGDRSFDAVAAGRNGMAAIGVAWGYGSRSELDAAGVAAHVARWSDVPAAVDAIGRRA
jgi:phosphoglycolate phosphatase